MAGLIYEPKGRAREYAALACNVYKGCQHGCVYCYAPDATFQERGAFTRATTRARDFLPKMAKEAQALGFGGCRERVLLSFTCDPYQQIDVEHQVTRQAIQIIHGAGLAVEVLTKGGTRALRDLGLFTERDAFASTLTFLDDERSRQWEPEAALPGNRLEAIRQFHAKGIPTWVSLEPVIDPAAALAIIRETAGYVDLFKVGKLNYHPVAKTIDWARFAVEAVALLQSLGKAYYVKKDLACLLPQAA